MFFPHWSWTRLGGEVTWSRGQAIACGSDGVLHSFAAMLRVGGEARFHSVRQGLHSLSDHHQTMPAWTPRPPGQSHTQLDSGVSLPARCSHTHSHYPTHLTLAMPTLTYLLLP